MASSSINNKPNNKQALQAKLSSAQHEGLILKKKLLGLIDKEKADKLLKSLRSKS